MILTKEQIEQITALARLELTEDEKLRYAVQLSTVLDYINILSEVDTSEVDETCQVTGLEDVVREDVAKSCSPDVRKKLLEQFPDRLGELLRVKAVFKEE